MLIGVQYEINQFRLSMDFFAHVIRTLFLTILSLRERTRPFFFLFFWKTYPLTIEFFLFLSSFVSLQYLWLDIQNHQIQTCFHCTLMADHGKAIWHPPVHNEISAYCKSSNEKLMYIFIWIIIMVICIQSPRCIHRTGTCTDQEKYMHGRGEFNYDIYIPRQQGIWGGGGDLAHLRWKRGNNSEFFGGLHVNQFLFPFTDLTTESFEQMR